MEKNRFTIFRSVFWCRPFIGIGVIIGVHMRNEIYDIFDEVQIGKISLDNGYEVNKQERYSGPGTAAEILYNASDGGMDWVKNMLKTPLVYTYDLRGNSFHWPPSRISEQGEEVTKMILGFAIEVKRWEYY